MSDENTIEKFEKLLYSETIGSEQISPMTIDEFNAMIDKSENDHKNGNVIEAKGILNQIDKWQLKLFGQTLPFVNKNKFTMYYKMEASEKIAQ